MAVISDIAGRRILWTTLLSIEDYQAYDSKPYNRSSILISKYTVKGLCKKHRMAWLDFRLYKKVDVTCMKVRHCHKSISIHIDGLVQERHNSSVLAMELHLSRTNLSILYYHISIFWYDISIYHMHHIWYPALRMWVISVHIKPHDAITQIYVITYYPVLSQTNYANISGPSTLCGSH